MYLGATVVWVDEENPCYYVLWNGSATFSVYLHGREIDMFTRYGVEGLRNAIQAAHEWMTEETD
jgi:hypothetical protein